MTDWLNTSDLRIGYAQGKALAGPLDIAFHPGELVCLVGPNGSGKSTLLRTLAGLLPALSGNVLLQGSLLPDLSLAERARRVALVPSGSQAPQGMSAMDSVALGRSPHTGWWGKLSAKDREIVQSALLQTDCSALAQRKISELSDGERQRLSVARALAQEARMLLLDEPTAFLDLPHRVSLMGLLRTLCREQDLGVLLSTHDLDLALRFADRILVLDGQGGFAVDLPETLALEGVFQQVFSTPQVVFDPVGGGFRLEEGPGAPICLRGEGVAHIWTCRALRRKGWTLVEEGYPCVEVRTENGTPQWRILVSVEDVREVFSLEALLSALRNWKM